MAYWPLLELGKRKILMHDVGEATLEAPCTFWLWPHSGNGGLPYMIEINPSPNLRLGATLAFSMTILKLT